MSLLLLLIQRLYAQQLGHDMRLAVGRRRRGHLAGAVDAADARDYPLIPSPYMRQAEGRRRRWCLAGAVDAADARGAAHDGRLGGRRLQGAQRAGLRRLACLRRDRHRGGAPLV